MQVPALLRQFQIADGADDDWAAEQTTPPVAICANVQGVLRMGASYVAYEADGTTVATGTSLDIQLIDVATPALWQGQQLPVLITGAPIDTGIPAGEGLEYDVSSCRLVTLRVANIADPGTAVSVNIFWRALE